MSKRLMSCAPVLLSVASMAVLASHALAADIASAGASAPARPFVARAIVNGHRVQPRASTYAAPNPPDIGASDAKELDALYRRQIGRAPAAGR